MYVASPLASSGCADIGDSKASPLRNLQTCILSIVYTSNLLSKFIFLVFVKNRMPDPEFFIAENLPLAKINLTKQIQLN